MTKHKLLSHKFLFFLVIIFAVTSFYFYKQSKALKNPDAISEKEVANIVERVGQHILLPPNETPTIATVSDPEALQDQAFFSQAKKGDKVLIYTDSKKAILYDPEIDKIIAVAPLTISDSPTGAITAQDI